MSPVECVRVGMSEGVRDEEGGEREREGEKAQGVHHTHSERT